MVCPCVGINYIITSYVAKDEIEMGLINQVVSNEMKNLVFDKHMNKAVHPFANSRAVSAQEAV